ncbi:MAG: tetratricopeptide repeat protein, partial [Terriglobales bacterium]
ISWNDLNARAEKEFNLAHFANAGALFKASIAEAETFGPTDPRLATALNDYGNLCYKLDRFPEAEKSIKRALTIREQVFGRDSLQAADSANDLAMVYCAEHNYKDAEAILKHILAVRKTLAGADSDDAIDSQKTLAIVYNGMHRTKEALPLLEHVVAVRMQKFGANNADVIEARNSLARTLEMLGTARSLADAREMYKEALASGERLYGKEHPLVSDSMVGLATVEFNLHHYAAAKTLFEEALAIRQKIFGNDSPECAEVQRCLKILRSTTAG